MRTDAEFWELEELLRLRDHFRKLEPPDHTFLYSAKVAGMVPRPYKTQDIIAAERSVRKTFAVDESTGTLVPRDPSSAGGSES